MEGETLQEAPGSHLGKKQRLSLEAGNRGRANLALRWRAIARWLAELLRRSSLPNLDGVKPVLEAKVAVLEAHTNRLE